MMVMVGLKKNLSHSPFLVWFLISKTLKRLFEFNTFLFLFLVLSLQSLQYCISKNFYDPVQTVKKLYQKNVLTKHFSFKKNSCWVSI